MIAETLEIDPTLIKMMQSKDEYSDEKVIVLPFQVTDGDRLFSSVRARNTSK